MRKKRPAHSKGKQKKWAKPTNADRAPDRRQASRLRKWLTRLAAAVLAPIIFLLLLELGLRLFGYGYATSYFIKAEDREVYLSNPRFGWRFFGPDLSREPIPTVLPAPKPDNTYRIFVFGGSAAKGVPNWTFSFARILEAMLNDRYALARFEVINTGMIAINSHVALPIARDCAEFDGDLFVVYMGSNEVVGPYGAGTVIKGFNPWLATIRASIRLRSTRVGQLLGGTIRALGGRGENENRTWRGMEMFLDNRVTADDPRLKSVYDNFAANLADICKVARRTGAKVILSTVVTNLKDCPPFASVHREGLSAYDKADWGRLIEEGKKLEESAQWRQAVRPYHAAAKIDDKFAQLHFRLGRCYLALGKPAAAREHFVRARDLDALRFRADTTINDTIRRVARTGRADGVHLVDAARTVARGGRTVPGIPGSELLYEHVHLTFEGNYAVAAAIFEKVSELLPQAVRGGSAIGAAPPSLARCAELVMFTPADRATTARGAADITSRPPFTKQQHARMLAKCEILRVKLTPDVMESIFGKYRRVLARRPDDLAMRRNFAQLLDLDGQYQAVEQQFRRLLGDYPHSGIWRYNLGLAIQRQGRWRLAIEEYVKAVDLRPGDLKIRHALAEALMNTGQFGRAIEHYRRAIELAPDDVAPLNGLAQIRAVAPDDEFRDGPQAVRLARRACELSKDSPLLLDTLAAAYAENGQFEQAVTTAREAEDLAQKTGQRKLAEDIGKRLRLYLGNKPFRWSTAP